MLLEICLARISTSGRIRNFYTVAIHKPRSYDDLITCSSVSELDSWTASAISRRALTARRATRYRFLPPPRSRRAPVMPFPTLTFVTGKPRGRAGKPWLETFDVKEMSTHSWPLPFPPSRRDVLLFRGMRARNAL